MSENTTRQRLNTFLVHLLCITILLIVPEALTTLSSSRPLRPWVFAQAIIYLGVFYINYYYIIERSLDRQRNIFRVIVYNIFVIAVALILLYLLWRYRSIFGGKPPLHRHPDAPESAFIAKWIVKASRDLVMLILVIGLAAALRIGDRWLRLDRRQRDLVSSQREVELSNLKNQINPHFLFNTLNSIYALIDISPDEARNALHELSRLLRYMLYDTPSSVPVKQEADFISNYISLMKIRLNPAIRLSYSVSIAGNENLQVAPLILVTIIENVFKHGIFTPEIPITIDLEASAGTLTCITTNGIAPAPHGSHAHQHSPGGIGLANLRRRLDLIYGRNASLTTETSDGIFKATLKITNLTSQLCH